MYFPIHHLAATALFSTSTDLSMIKVEAVEAFGSPHLLP
jgi:hypothetical protein